MTDQTTNTDQATRSAVARRTRRQLLAVGTGALAVLSAGALARPAAASAANGGNVILGQDNSETSHTTITNSTDADDALDCVAIGSGNGVLGSSDSGAGVAGISGVAAVGSNSHTGVLGSTDSGDGVGGFSRSGRGVYGQSGSTGPGFANITNGVHGVTDSAAGVGVIGENANGTAVGGISSTSDGVGGTSSSGTGVHGVSSTGIGVLAECPSGTGVRATGATALSVQGPAVFSRSGTLTIAAGGSSATQTGVALTASSLVLATLQQDRAGVWVRSAVPNIPGSSFTVHLSRVVPAAMSVAWFVVN
jgi:hypothetical protein